MSEYGSMSTYHGVRTRHGLMTCHDMVVRHDTMTCHDMMTLYGTMPPNNTTTRPNGRTAVRRPGHGQMVSSGEMSYPVSNCRAGVRWPHWGEIGEVGTRREKRTQLADAR